MRGELILLSNGQPQRGEDLWERVKGERSMVRGLTWAKSGEVDRHTKGTMSPRSEGDGRGMRNTLGFCGLGMGLSSTGADDGWEVAEEGVASFGGETTSADMTGDDGVAVTAVLTGDEGVASDGEEGVEITTEFLTGAVVGVAPVEDGEGCLRWTFGEGVVARGASREGVTWRSLLQTLLRT
jgi:hypothetical protein